MFFSVLLYGITLYLLNHTSQRKMYTEQRELRKLIPAAKKKWVDDLTLVLPLSLKNNLIIETRSTIARPVPYHGRTGQRLLEENNPIEIKIYEHLEYCRAAKLFINKQKTKCMLFNKASKEVLFSYENSACQMKENLRLSREWSKSGIRSDLN